MIKTLIKLGVATSAVAVVVHQVRKHDLVNKTAAVVDTGIKKASAAAENFVAQGVGLVDGALRQFAEAEPSPASPEGRQAERDREAQRREAAAKDLESRIRAAADQAASRVFGQKTGDKDPWAQATKDSAS